MSRHLPGEQVEHGFNPKRLCNWETPRQDEKGLANTIGGSRFGTLVPRSGRTSFIVDDRGHLMPGTAKVMNAFTAQVPVYCKNPARWPQENAAIPYAPRSTMGFKGIITTYLPTSTVALKASEVPGSHETNYNFR